MRIVTIVVTPFKLFYVAVHLLNAHLVKRPYDGTLKQAPYALNAVCMNIPYNPFLLGVVDGLVTGSVHKKMPAAYPLGQENVKF